MKKRIISDENATSYLSYCHLLIIPFPVYQYTIYYKGGRQLKNVSNYVEGRQLKNKKK